MKLALVWPRTPESVFGVYAAGEGVRSEDVAQIVEAHIRQPRPLEQRFHVAISRIGINRVFRLHRVWEDPLADGIRFASPQDFSYAMRQDDGALTAAGLGLARHIDAQLSAMEGSAHLQDTVPCIKILPHEPADLAPPQTGGQFHVEEVTPVLIAFDGFHCCPQPLSHKQLPHFCGNSYCFSA